MKQRHVNEGGDPCLSRFPFWVFSSFTTILDTTSFEQASVIRLSPTCTEALIVHHSCDFQSLLHLAAGRTGTICMTTRLLHSILRPSSRLGLQRQRQMSLFALDPPKIPTVPIADHPDLVFPVHRIYCVGRNYADHTKEMGGDPTREDPFFFLKPADAVVPCDGTAMTETIPYPLATRNFHHEVELVIAMSSANDIFGYAVGIDLTRRDLQASAKKQGRPWCSAKGFDLSGPMSGIRKCDSQRILDEARLWITVNGVERQSGTPSSDMIWSIDEILSSLRTQFEICAGDLIFTGTPAGVGPLQVGDEVRAGMDGIGELSFRVS